MTAGGWLLWGMSLWATLHAVIPGGPPWSWALWGRFAAYVALAYVAGFVIVIVPGGIGVREFLLTLFLVPEISHLTAGGPDQARGLALLVVLLLRVVWTAAEALVAGLVYWLPGPKVLKTQEALPDVLQEAGS